MFVKPLGICLCNFSKSLFDKPFLTCFPFLCKADLYVPSAFRHVYLCVFLCLHCVFCFVFLHNPCIKHVPQMNIETEKTEAGLIFKLIFRIKLSGTFVLLT